MNGSPTRASCRSFSHGMSIATRLRMRRWSFLVALVIVTMAPELRAQERRGFVRVHIVSGQRKVRLRKESMPGGKSRVVCTAPCGRVIDARGGDLYFEGDGFPDSVRFNLAAVEGEVIARVRPGSWGSLLGAKVMEGFGVSLLAFALVVFGAAVKAEDDAQRFHPAWKIAAPIAAVTGVGLIFGGLWIGSDSPTTFTLERR